MGARGQQTASCILWSTFFTYTSGIGIPLGRER
jgi:hypothetical protein